MNVSAVLLCRHWDIRQSRSSPHPVSLNKQTNKQTTLLAYSSLPWRASRELWTAGFVSLCCDYNPFWYRRLRKNLGKIMPGLCLHRLRWCPRCKGLMIRPGPYPSSCPSGMWIQQHPDLERVARESFCLVKTQRGSSTWYYHVTWNFSLVNTKGTRENLEKNG